MMLTDDELIVLSNATDEQMKHVRSLSDTHVEQLERLVDEERRWAERASKAGSPTAEALERHADILQDTLILARVARDKSRLEDVLMSG